jgi:hypothetical protein
MLSIESRQWIFAVQCRVRHQQLFGSVPEMAVLGDCHDISKMSQFPLRFLIVIAYQTWCRPDRVRGTSTNGD